MNFVSIEFILFFPLVLFLYWILPFQYRWIHLLVSSYFFYLIWAPWTLLLLLTTTLISYIASRMIEGAKSRALRNFWLITTLIVCLGCLIVFKYLGFLTENVTTLLHLFGIPMQDIVLKIFLPVGISFYTFQTLSYVIDVYRGDIQAEKHLGYYALFVSYFPQLVAGPIERPSNLLPQLREKHFINPVDLVDGLKLMLRGFFKKLVIADYLATYVDVVYAAPDQADGPAIVIATVMFAFQIYCDFSGYSDIASGVARMMGIRLMKNFDHPYSATSIQDFWRRWHISLTTWLSDYIYKPLGGSRRGVLRRCVNVLIVFLISGAWHGASWTYIIWGGIHGVYMLVGILWRNLRGEYKRTRSSVLSDTIRCLFTFTLVCFAWLVFRANSLTDLVVLLHGLFTGWTSAGIDNMFAILQLDVLALIRITLMLFCLWQLKRLPVWGAARPESSNSLQECAKTALFVFEMITLIALTWLSLLSINAASSFIYFQF